MQKSNIKKNVIYQMCYEFLVLLLPLVTSPYISRVLGADNLGIYSYTYSIASYFGMVAMLGVKNYGNREIAKNRDDRDKLSRIFWSIYAVQFTISVLVVMIYLIYTLCFSGEYRFYSFIHLTYVLACMLDISWFFFGMEQFKLTVARSTAVKIFTFVAVFCFVHSPDDLWKYCLLMSGSNFISQFIIWRYVFKYVHIERLKVKNVIPHIKPMLILFIPVFAVSLYNIMDKIMLGSLSTKAQLGFYENSEKITFCVKSVITAFGTVMMPRMSKLASDGNLKESGRYMSLSIEIVMCTAFALSFGIASVAGIFAPIFWGKEFTPCGVLLIGLCVSIPFTAFANVIRTQYLIPNNMDKEYIISVVAGAVVNVIANAILIPQIDALGAVIGTIFAEAIVCIIQCLYVKGKIDVAGYLKKSVPFLVFGFIMWLILFVVNQMSEQTFLWLLIEIAIGGAIYLLMALIYFIKTKNELVLGLLRKIKVRR